MVQFNLITQHKIQTTIRFKYMYFEKCLNAVPVSTGTTLEEQLAYIPPISTTMQHNGNESIPQIFARKVDFTTENICD